MIGGPSATLTNGNGVQLYTCWCGGQNQIWKQDGNKIKIAGTNKCLDAGVGATDGTGAQLQIYDCYDGRSQKFGLTQTSAFFQQAALDDTMAPYQDMLTINITYFSPESVLIIPLGSTVTFDVSVCSSGISRVSSAAFLSCNLTDSSINPSLISNGSDTLRINGDVYYICSDTNTCLQGQRQHIIAGIVSINPNSKSGTIASGTKNVNGDITSTSTSTCTSTSLVFLTFLSIVITLISKHL